MKSETVSAVIGSIYDAAYDPSHWPQTVAMLRTVFNASKACFARFGIDHDFYHAVATDHDEGFSRRLLAEHAPKVNVLAEAVYRAPVGLVYHDHALVGGDALKRSRLWNDWMAPQDMYGGLASKLVMSSSNLEFFDVQRGRNQPAFDADEVALLQMLTPHLMRAARIGMNSVQAQLAALSYLSFGIVHVDPELRVIHMNAEAEALIVRRGGAFQLRAGLLSMSDARAAAQLLRLVSNACAIHDGIVPGPGGDMLIHDNGDDPRHGDVMLSVGPLMSSGAFGLPSAPHAVIFLREVTLALPEDFADHTRRLFDLSPSEARLAAALAAGQSLNDAAAAQGIRVSTARSYLESVFRKTRTHQQSQLVALLKSAQPLIRRP